jgi:16S rRNA (guanine527-N7)-methyltransferase
VNGRDVTVGENAVPGGLAGGAAALGIVLDNEQLARFAAYAELLIAWNERLNLTAAAGREEIETRHFLDSLSCALATGELDGRRLVDVGAGAGFPGLPLKILFPGTTLTLIESVAKKARFLEKVVAELALADVAILVERAEVVGHMEAERGQYDWAVARAVAALPVLAEYLLPLCRPGGRMLAMKGARAAEESAAAVAALEILGGGAPILNPVQLPGHPQSRFLVVVEKIAVTPERYPRRVGVPRKRPL